MCKWAFTFKLDLVVINLNSTRSSLGLQLELTKESKIHLEIKLHHVMW